MVCCFTNFYGTQDKQDSSVIDLTTTTIFLLEYKDTQFPLNRSQFRQIDLTNCVRCDAQSLHYSYCPIPHVSPKVANYKALTMILPYKVGSWNSSGTVY